MIYFYRFLCYFPFPALIKESSSDISAAFVSTNFKALYRRIFLNPCSMLYSPVMTTTWSFMATNLIFF